jgi:hypothetical protein
MLHLLLIRDNPVPNQFAGVAAGRPPEFIEMMQVGRSHDPGLARFWGRR